MSNLNRWAPHVLSLLRLVAGLLFLAHGTQKLLGYPPGGPASLAMFSMIWFQAVIEIVCGILIALGLFTRAAAFLASGDMAVAYFMMHAPKHPVPAANGGDAAVLYCFVFLYLVFAGAGPISLDKSLRRTL